MKLAIMQPYLFPYIGYFQLINAVDTFVVYDDVNYIKKGWINRNYILLHGRKHLVTLSLEAASQFRQINQIEIGRNRNRVLKTIHQAYAKAPHYKKLIPLVEDILLCEENNLARYIANSLYSISDYLDIKTNFVMSSEIEKDTALKGQEKILQICSILNAKDYINAFGGIELYDKDKFRRHDRNIYFLKTGDIKYNQYGNEFVPNLSMIDVLMFNGRDEIKKQLHEYELV